MTFTFLVHLLSVFIHFLLEFQLKCRNRGKAVEVWHRAMQRKKKKRRWFLFYMRWRKKS